jgi:glycosyltransferase involved in cell wall biosynthesis
MRRRFQVPTIEEQSVMKLGLVVPSRGRPEIVRNLLFSLRSQSRAPDEVVFSVTEPTDMPEIASCELNAKVIFGAAGLCAQRNRAIDYLIGTTSIICFIDDDFVPDADYFANVERLFADDQSLAGVTGDVIVDGAKSTGYSFKEGVRIVADYKQRLAGRPVEFREQPRAYGCNMAFRAQSIGSLRFDERLPLYGWQEDIDFCGALSATGRIVWTNLIWGVHLGAKLGKVSGVRLGYSQIINPIYIMSKGNMPLRYAARLALQNLLANAAKSFFPESYIDRRGRLKGNLIALSHLLRGRVDPEYILQL